MHSSITPAYWKKSLKVLASSHPELATIIAQLPKGACIERRSSSAFTSLLRSITGQQISMKAAASIWNKLQDTIGIITPETILENTDLLRSCGYSEQKKKYIIDLAERFIEHNLEERIPESTFEDIQSELIAIKGIGKWTTEMFGIFYMFHPDLWPADDLGLLNALVRLYPDEEFSQVYASTKKLTSSLRTRVEGFGQRFAPYRSVACWLLWRSLDSPVTMR